MSLTKVTYSMIQGAVANVLDYGADPTGVADSTAAIQNAINSSYHTIYLPAGTYKTTSTLSITSVSGSEKKLIGAGTEATIINHIPASYVNTNWAVWFGNNTQNTPSPIYACVYPEMTGITIACSATSAGGLRVREAIHGRFENINIRPISGQTLGTATNKFTGFKVDGAIHSRFTLIDSLPLNGYTTGTELTIAGDVSQSSNLANTAGSGSGASVTTCSFNECYFHYAADSLLTSSTNAVSFNDCIFEAAARGVYVAGSGFPLELNGCYWEAISAYPVRVDGTGLTTRASVVVRGGMYQSDSKLGDAASAGNPFLSSNYCGKVSIENLLVIGQKDQQSYIASTNSGKLVFNAYSNETYTNPLAGVGTSSGELTTTSGSAILEVVHVAHGLAVGDVVGLSGYATPQNALAVNQPFYRVISVVNVDRYTVKSVQFPALLAAGTSTVTTPAAQIIKYPAGTWLNCVIQEAGKVTLADCRMENLLFSEYFASGGGQVNLLYGSSGGTGVRSYKVDDWTYVMTVQKVRDVTGGAESGCYLYVDYPTGYEQAFIIANVPDFSTGTGLIGAVANVGLKVPPGTTFRFSIAPGVASTLQGRVVLARTGIE